MLYKLEKEFVAVTKDIKNPIRDQQEFDYLTQRLLERKIIIEHDKNLFSKHIKDFPFFYDNFINYITEIYKLDIENSIEHKINSHEEILNSINKFLSFLTSVSKLTNEDIVQILTSILKSNESIQKTLLNFNKSKFIINSIHDDIQKFLWEKIYETMRDKNEEFFKSLDVTFDDPEDYQFKYQEKINYEYEIIRVKKFHYKNENISSDRIGNKIICEDAYCSDRNILIKCYKIPNIYYDKNVLESFYYQCESGRELLLSKYFVKFLGFDDITNEEFQFYFYENIEGMKLLDFFLSVETENPETSFFFKYIAKEILQAFRDLLNKCTYSFKFPITIDNFYYDKIQYRLLLKNLQFGAKRKSIMESHQIVEAKLLYFYGMILLNLLSLKYSELKDLIYILNKECNNLEEFGKMQKIFENLPKIEKYLSSNLVNDTIICIIIECLLSPYKAKLVFDEFYDKKNFLKKAIESRKKEKKDDNNNNEEEEKINENEKKEEMEDENDKTAVLEPYYLNDTEVINENVIKKSLTVNLLLIHPFYSNTNLDEQFLKYIFSNSKEESIKIESV